MAEFMPHVVPGSDPVPDSVFGMSNKEKECNSSLSQMLDELVGEDKSTKKRSLQASVASVPLDTIPVQDRSSLGEGTTPVLAPVVPFKLVHSERNCGDLDEQLSEIKDILARRNTAECQALLSGSRSFVFHYKKRRCQGGAIHIAALHKDGHTSLRVLMALRADISAECRYTASGKEGLAQPIHLAAQSSLCSVQALLEGGAEVDARSRVNGRDHFCPIHEAAFFRNIPVLDHLLACGAELDAVNLDGFTALHVSAKMGTFEAVELLVRNNADIRLRDKEGKTALELAVESGVFPQRRLHLLGKFRIADIMVVAQYCPSATRDFMKGILSDYRGTSATQMAYKMDVPDELQADEDVEVGHWLELMQAAPDAANYLLENLTVEPDEDSVFYHPLPRQAILHELRCDYNTDTTWKCDTEKTLEADGKRWPEWHERLAPGAYKHRQHKQGQRLRTQLGTPKTQSPDKDVVDPALLEAVQMRQLRLRGIVCTEVLAVLADTTDLDCFRNHAVQAILQYCWHCFVERWYAGMFAYRVLELLVLCFWTWQRIASDTRLDVPSIQRRFSWSILCVMSLRDTIRELCQIHGWAVTLHYAKGYFSKLGNYIDLGTILAFDLILLQAAWHGDFRLDSWGSRPTEPQSSSLGVGLFAIIVLSRWLRMMFELRAFELGGVGIQGIIPILHSIKSITAMIIICGFMTCGFVHSILILDQNRSGSEWWTVMSTLNLLFMVGDEGIMNTLAVGGRSAEGDALTAFFLMAAVLLFCISLLNLFIAVHSQAYSEAHAQATGLFLQERASICLHGMMQPHLSASERFKGCCCRDPRAWRVRACWCILAALSFGLWISLIQVESCHPAIPMLFLCIASETASALLLQRPWLDEQERVQSFLWWCRPTRNVIGNQEDQAASMREITERMSRVEAAFENHMNTVSARASAISDMLPEKSMKRVRSENMSARMSAPFADQATYLSSKE